MKEKKTGTGTVSSSPPTAMGSESCSRSPNSSFIIHHSSFPLRPLLLYTLLTLLALTTLAPFLWMFFTSLHPPLSPIPTPKPLFAPTHFAFNNYSYVLFFPELPVARFALNSILVTTTVVLFQLTICSLAAYAFARLTFPGRDTLFLIFLLTMMIPATVMIVPLFLTVHHMGLLNTYAGLILPYPYLSTAFGTFLLRQFFISIPKSLDEAARLDGASDLQIYWHIILPASKPALATLAAFGFIWTWTDFYWPMLATSTPSMRTLEVGLSIFKDSYGGTNWPLQMTAAVIVMTPALLFFLALQRYFVKGIVLTGVKG